MSTVRESLTADALQGCESSDRPVPDPTLSKKKKATPRFEAWNIHLPDSGSEMTTKQPATPEKSTMRNSKSAKTGKRQAISSVPVESENCAEAELSVTRAELAAAHACIDRLECNSALQLEENARLGRLLEETQRDLARVRQQLAGAGNDHSESLLRALLLDQHSTSEQLLEAASAHEVLLQEVRREASAKQFRERRAVFERLHTAIDATNEAMLAEAVAEARRVKLDAEDVEKGEQKLSEMRSLTEEERAAKVAREINTKNKEQAFLLAKKEQVGELEELLNSVGIEQWQTWKDHAGRTLLQFARQFSKVESQRCLSTLLGIAQPDAVAKTRPRVCLPKTETHHCELPHQRGAPVADSSPPMEVDTPPPTTPRGFLKREARTPCLPPDRAPVADSPLMEVDTPLPTTPRSFLGREARTPPCQSRDRNSSMTAFSSRPSLGCMSVMSMDSGCVDHAEAKVAAFRAVARDRVENLENSLDDIPSEIWSEWKNKGGKDLLSLAQERGSSNAYSFLATKLGILQEMKPEVYELREDVWVFLPGDVQPRRATVTGCASHDASSVQVEFWDDTAPSSRVDKTCLRKLAC